ncbi:unnamed protein product [Rotaria magnacalcarata]|uniref:Uncharacterized protein n=1 Tax=Rotaria magnacalcarata TaxID=392030 RepID=A0A815NP28_9BILA|nr:unnamed protein product [Rotaria magnacalcarata]CAF1457322.1 unnamed protein product [Rotaria magnacalcarata]
MSEALTKVYLYANFQFEFLLNLDQLASVSSSSAQTKSSNVSWQVPLNNSLTNIHRITIEQPMIYLFVSRHASTISSDTRYVNTNENDFQAALLDLLVQLLLIRVDYSLLDGDESQSLFDIYSIQLTLFDVISSIPLQPIDRFVVAFRALTNRNVQFFL